MDPPKILWLKENLYDACYARAAHFFSLPDYLVWRCTGKNVRSMCCLACKWLYKYDESEKRWDESFWRSIGLADLVDNEFGKIGGMRVENPFKNVNELTIISEAREELGLCGSDLRVGVAMIDAHACSIGALAVAKKYASSLKLSEILVIVSGTSACLMASSTRPTFIDGIWGPYYEAMLPGLWLNEAGQSACGQLIQHIVTTHPAYSTLADYDKQRMFDKLHIHLNEMAEKQNLTDISLLTRHVHIYPDFHGNRSPLSDPNMRGAVCGLSLDSSLDDLCVKYLACLQAIAYQTKQIVEKMQEKGIGIKLITLVGGLATNPLYTQLIADITRLPILVSRAKSDSIGLLGTTIVGASNSADLNGESIDRLFDLFAESFMDTNDLKLIEATRSAELERFHARKYEIYLKMLDDQRSYDKIMNN